MNLDWQRPFEIAWQLSLFMVGWVLVLIVAFIGFTLVWALLTAFVNIFKKKKADKLVPKVPNFKVFKGDKNS
jgi:uncharacterized integral membrane protein